jgi:hypothetical protein
MFSDRLVVEQLLLASNVNWLRRLFSRRLAFSRRLGRFLNVILLRVPPDVDDLIDGTGKEFVDKSHVIVVFVSAGYFHSPNCMRELLRAVLTNKMMVTLVETEMKHGALPTGDMERQLEQAIESCERWKLTKEVAQWQENEGLGRMPTSNQLVQALFGRYGTRHWQRGPACVLEWHRQPAFQMATLRMLAGAVLSIERRAPPKAAALSRILRQSGSTTSSALRQWSSRVQLGHGLPGGAGGMYQGNGRALKRMATSLSDGRTLRRMSTSLRHTSSRISYHASVTVRAARAELSTSLPPSPPGSTSLPPSPPSSPSPRPTPLSLKSPAHQAAGGRRHGITPSSNALSSGRASRRRDALTTHTDQWKVGWAHNHAYVRAELQMLLPQSLRAPSRERGRKYHLFVSEHNDGALALLDESSVMTSWRVEVDNAYRKREHLKHDSLLGLKQVLFVTTDVADLPLCEQMLVYLTDTTWTSGESSESFAVELWTAMSLQTKLLLAHEMPDVSVHNPWRHGSEFGDFFGVSAEGVHTTPPILKEMGIYHGIALPLKGGEYREASLALLADSIAGGKKPPKLSTQLLNGAHACAKRQHALAMRYMGTRRGVKRVDAVPPALPTQDEAERAIKDCWDAQQVLHEAKARLARRRWDTALSPSMRHSLLASARAIAAAPEAPTAIEEEEPPAAEGHGSRARIFDDSSRQDDDPPQDVEETSTRASHEVTQVTPSAVSTHPSVVKMNLAHMRPAMRLLVSLRASEEAAEAEGSRTAAVRLQAATRGKLARDLKTRLVWAKVQAARRAPIPMVADNGVADASSEKQASVAAVALHAVASWMAAEHASRAQAVQDEMAAMETALTAAVVEAQAATCRAEAASAQARSEAEEAHAAAANAEVASGATEEKVVSTASVEEAQRAYAVAHEAAMAESKRVFLHAIAEMQSERVALEKKLASSEAALEGTSTQLRIEELIKVKLTAKLETAALRISELETKLQAAEANEHRRTTEQAELEAKVDAGATRAERAEAALAGAYAAQGVLSEKLSRVQQDVTKAEAEAEERPATAPECYRTREEMPVTAPVCYSMDMLQGFSAATAIPSAAYQEQIAARDEPKDVAAASHAAATSSGTAEMPAGRAGGLPRHAASREAKRMAQRRTRFEAALSTTCTAERRRPPPLPASSSLCQTSTASAVQLVLRQPPSLPQGTSVAMRQDEDFNTIRRNARILVLPTTRPARVLPRSAGQS